MRIRTVQLLEEPVVALGGEPLTDVRQYLETHGLWFELERGRFRVVVVLELLARLDFVEHQSVQMRDAAELHWELLRFSASGYFELEGPYPVLVWALPLSLGSLLAEHLVEGRIQIGISLLESRTSLLITVVPGHATVRPATLLHVVEGETEASGEA